MAQAMEDFLVDVLNNAKKDDLIRVLDRVDSYVHGHLAGSGY
jgi:hypothetical protein